MANEFCKAPQIHIYGSLLCLSYFVLLTGSYSVAKAAFELMVILLPHLLECGNCRLILFHPA